MKFNKALISFGITSTLIFGISGNNTYAEAVEKPNSANIGQQTHTDIYKDLLLNQNVEFIGETSTSFKYEGSTNLSFFIKNMGNTMLGYSVKGPNDEPIIGGYLNPEEQKTNVTSIQTAVSPLPKGIFKINLSNDEKARGHVQITVKSSK